MSQSGYRRLVSYWEERGAAARDDELDAVCYAGAPGFLNDYADWSQRRAVDALLRAAGPVAGRRVLDVGCGTGRWSRALAGLGGDVVGVDGSAAMVEEAARRTPGARFVVGDVRSLEFDDDEFDLAIAVTVIQHLDPVGQEAAARAVTRVVRSGGHVISLDREGVADDFTRRHHTHPRPRDEWLALWRSAGATPVLVRGQEHSYPLRLAALARSSPSSAPVDGPPSRRGASGWRRHALRALVAASYATDFVVAAVAPRAPAEHVAALYRVER